LTHLFVSVSFVYQAFNLLLRRLKPLEHYQSYPTEFRDLSYLLSARAVSEAGESFDGWKWGGPAEGREELVEVLRGMQTHTTGGGSASDGGRNEGGDGSAEGGGAGEFSFVSFASSLSSRGLEPANTTRN